MASHHYGIASRCCKINYNTQDWRKFWEALVFLFEVERKLYETEIIPNQNNLKVVYKQMYQLIDDAEEMLLKKEQDQSEP
jgi:hypothetical protein